MSAHGTLLQCPICFNNGAFDAAESLRNRLIFVSTNKITCPVCQEEVIGLDKLTIHLFSHVKLPLEDDCKYKNNSEEAQCNLNQEDKNFKQHVNSSHQKKTKQHQAKNKTITLINSAAAAPVKFVKIYPKLPVVSLGMGISAEMSPVQTEGAIQPCKQYGNVKREASNEQTNTTCNICGLQFIDNNILKMHKCLIHNIEENLKQPATGYNCHLCPKMFKMRGSLMVHLRVAHYGFSSGNFQTETCINSNGVDSDLQSADKSLTMLKNDNKQWQCDVCRKCFTTKYFLKKHKRLHTGETPYSCAQCNKTFTFQQSYHKHLLYHNDEKPHVCNFCSRAFKELSTLHNHQRIHTGEKPFSCETCGKCFRQRVSYLVHRRIHTGVMPYKCTACEKSFRYKVSQRTHKCQVQPPGTVVRQSGDLVEKLKKKHADSVLETEISQEQEIPKGSYLEISEANAEIVRSGAKLSLEDTETEHFTLIADAFESLKEPSLQNVSEILDYNKKSDNNLKELLDSNFEDLIDEIQVEEKNVPSPSEILNKLCLSQEEDFTSPKENSNSYTNYDILNEFM